MGIEQIRAEGPVENTLHNLVQTLSVKLDSAARYRLYQEDARKDGYDDCAEVFERLAIGEREAIAELLRCLRARLGELRLDDDETRGSRPASEEIGSVAGRKGRKPAPQRPRRGRERPGKVNPIQLQKFLKGMDYPARKEELLRHAEQHAADEKVLAALRELPEREYEGPSGVSAEIGKAR